MTALHFRLTWLHLATVGLMLGAAAVLGWQLHRRHVEDELVRAEPDRVLTNAALVDFALGRAPTVYRRHCAGCHGRDMRGNTVLGAANLADSSWLFGLGDLADIEGTLDFGIRSGHPKSRNITDMPGLGRIGQLSAAEVQDVVEYVYAFSHADANVEAARRGHALFMDKGSCYDCHAPDGSGNVDYGAPDLTGRSGWLYGGDRRTLFQSVYDGRHGLCPAWGTRLPAVQIRELAILLYTKAHRGVRTAPRAAGAF